MKERLAAMVFISIIIFAGIVYQIQERIVFASFLEIERAHALADIERVVEAIKREGKYLATITTDWAVWDDSYQFITDRNQNYIESTLTPDSYISAKVNLIYFIDLSGNVVWGKTIDLESEEELFITQFPTEKWPLDFPLLMCESEENFKTGFMVTDHGPMILASSKILTSVRGGPCRGTLVMGRFLNDQLIDTLNTQTRIAFRIWPIAEHSLPASKQNAYLKLTEQRPLIELSTDDPNLMSIYDTLLDINQQPSILIRAQVARDMSRQGKKVVQMSLVLFIIIGAFLSLAGFFIVQKMVTGPLSSLTRHISEITAKGALSARLPDGGSAEIGVLVKEFNKLFTWLETDQKKQEQILEELQNAKTDAENATQAKSRFLAIMSHEIRTPINAIIGMADLTLETNLDPKQGIFLQTISSEANNLINLINDTLDLSKIEAGKFEIESIPFDLSCLLKDLSTAQAYQAAMKDVEYVSFLAPNAPTKLIGDPTRLRQILVNLISNAIKFTPSGGEVSVRCDVLNDKEHEVSLLFSVRDTGIGITANQLETIFDSFKQAEDSVARRYGGTGLGTTISKQLVDLMGGKMKVTSEEGKGSLFCFTLNLTKDASKTPALSAMKTSIAGTKILVIGLHDNYLPILSEYLEYWSCEATYVSSGQEARNILSQYSTKQKRFDLILSELHINDMNAFELAEILTRKGSLAETAMVIVTPIGSRGDGLKCRELGISGYLTKPIHKSDLFNTIALATNPELHIETLKAPLITSHFLKEHSQGGVKILLVEDYPPNQQLATINLQNQGFYVDLAENGEKAVAMAEDKLYDLILMDIQMPIMDGFEATKAIRKLNTPYCDVPIIAMTAHAMVEDKEKCLEVGMNDYLTKPLRKKLLIDTISKWLARPEFESPHLEGTEAEETISNDEKNETVVIVDRELADIVPGFFEQFQMDLENMLQANSTSDFETLRSISHSIKGAGGGFGFHKISDIASKIETAAIAKDSETITKELELLKEYHSQIEIIYE